MRCPKITAEIKEISITKKRILDGLIIRCKINKCEVPLLSYKSHIVKCEQDHKNDVICWNCNISKVNENELVVTRQEDFTKLLNSIEQEELKNKEQDKLNKNLMKEVIHLTYSVEILKSELDEKCLEIKDLKLKLEDSYNNKFSKLQKLKDDLLRSNKENIKLKGEIESFKVRHCSTKNNSHTINNKDFQINNSNSNNIMIHYTTNCFDNSSQINDRSRNTDRKTSTTNFYDEGNK